MLFKKIFSALGRKEVKSEIHDDKGAELAPLSSGELSDDELEEVCGLTPYVPQNPNLTTNLSKEEVCIRRKLF